MNNYTIGRYTRISKARARKLYAAGEAVYICPVKLNPENMYQPAAMIRYYPTDSNICMKSGAVSVRNYAAKNGDSGEGEREFDLTVNAFEFYNCDYERGYYAAFYTKEG